MNKVCEKAGIEYNCKNRCYNIYLYEVNDNGSSVNTITIRDFAFREIARQVLNVDVEKLERLEKSNITNEQRICELQETNTKLINALTKLVDKIKID